MEFFKKKYPDSKEVDKKDIVYSKSVKAGKRIYYLDVKQSRNEEWYLAITESKRSVVDNGPGASPDIRFEKHKIFLYPEDMQHFSDCLSEMIAFIRSNQPHLFDKFQRQDEDMQLENGALVSASESSDNEVYKSIDLDFGDFE